MIQLRTANIDDLPIIIYRDTPEQVIASDPDDDWNWAYELPRIRYGGRK